MRSRLLVVALLAVVAAPRPATAQTPWAGLHVPMYGCDTFTPGVPGPGPYACALGSYHQFGPTSPDPDRPGLLYAATTGGGTITFNVPGRIVGFEPGLLYQLAGVSFTDATFGFDAVNYYPALPQAWVVWVEYDVGTPGMPDFRTVQGTVLLSAIPEPATVSLVATGVLALLGLGAVRRRRA